ncbi:STAS domain-containing protein [Lentzea sp.]|uniref:STAS domain-containing protein n=1 Tax=Lentzea sp. TaxID=56099 RepID=UPI002C799901|nr:STAS domain-containing protein [Lentzea sp.]HUQ57209.1 STAS domain-containing protein [Lentzea sp.]
MEQQFNEAADLPTPHTVDHDGITVVVLAGELDMKTAKTLLADTLLVVDQQPKGIVIDLHAVSFFGSAGISLLVSVQREAELQGVSFGVVAPGKAVTRSLTASGMNTRLPMFPTVADAVTAIRASSE